jgi:hypothetical protein
LEIDVEMSDLFFSDERAVIGVLSRKLTGDITPS